MVHCIVLTTTDDADVAKNIVQHLLKQKLAACVQVIPIESHYVWQEELCSSDEKLLVIKTTQSLYQDVEQKIVEVHNYDTPQVLQLDIVDGFNPYLAWLELSTRR